MGGNNNGASGIAHLTEDVDDRRGIGMVKGSGRLVSEN